MSFTGKATYSAGATLPELAEDVSDVIGIVSPYETPLLDVLGDSMRSAMSTYHEWMEDELFPNKDVVVSSEMAADTSIGVQHGDYFRIGDQIQVDGSKELMLVTNVVGNTLTVQRGYAGTTAVDIAADSAVSILGNAALEGSDKPKVRFSNRLRKGNYTQIFTAGVEVSGTDLAASQLGLADEMDYQKQERLRELIRDLENTVINGGQAASNPQGTDTVRRTMRGIIQHIQTNVIQAGVDPEFLMNMLDEELLNKVLRKIWQQSCGTIDLIVVNGNQKRRINQFLMGNRSFGPDDTTYRSMVSLYESDFGICKIVTSRWMPQDAMLLLDSSRINVLPMSGRSFHFKSLASGGDYECGELIGEYTLEMKNENAHALVRGLMA